MGRTDGRIPPYNLNAECAVLGAVLLNNDALRLVMGVVKPEHFYVEAHRRIFDKMIQLKKDDAPIDHVTLGTALMESGDLEKIGGAVALSKLADFVATTANVDHYAKIVGDAAACRAMIYAAQEVVAQGYTSAIPAEDYLAKSRQTITLAANHLSGRSTGPRRVDQDAQEVLKEISDGRPPEGMITTGFKGIDSISGGLWPGLLHVLAARPSMGKSLVALNIANNASQRGDKVLYITLEDTRKLTVYRMFSRYANIDLSDLTLARVSKLEQFQRLTAAMIQISNKPLWIDDTAGLTSDAVVQICANHQATEGLDLVIIDHLNEVSDKGESETVITTHAAQNFRNIAKDLNVPVLLLCQLNRKVEARSDKRPTLQDLRQSGAIEQVARFVWFLYRHGYYTGETDRRDMEWDIAKSSHGRTGMVKMFAELSRMYARDWNVPTDGLWPGDDGDTPIPEHKKPKKYENYGGHENY